MTQPPRVYMTRRIPDTAMQLLKPECDVQVWPQQLPPATEELCGRARGCDALLTLLSDRIDGPVMDAIGPQLKVICNFAVGYNNIDVAAAAERGIRVGNTPDVLTAATADMAICLLLAATRNLKRGMHAVSNGDWKTWEPLGYLGSELENRTLGIIGAGRIGRAVAGRAHGGWNMKILYHSRSAKPEWESSLQAVKHDLPSLLAESDFVSLHCPLTPETDRMLNADRLGRMKPGAIVVNTARGEVIDQDALVHALQTGPIAAAGLDVTTPEPLDPQHPLVGLENCVIAPHIGSATHEARDAMAAICAKNILAALQGNPMPAEVRG